MQLLLLLGFVAIASAGEGGYGQMDSPDPAPTAAPYGEMPAADEEAEMPEDIDLDLSNYGLEEEEEEEEIMEDGYPMPEMPEAPAAPEGYSDVNEAEAPEEEIVVDEPADDGYATDPVATEFPGWEMPDEEMPEPEAPNGYADEQADDADMAEEAPAQGGYMTIKYLFKKRVVALKVPKTTLLNMNPVVGEIQLKPRCQDFSLINCAQTKVQVEQTPGSDWMTFCNTFSLRRAGLVKDACPKSCLACTNQPFQFVQMKALSKASAKYKALLKSKNL